MGRVGGVVVIAVVALGSASGCGPAIAFCDEVDDCEVLGQGSTGGMAESSDAADAEGQPSTTGLSGGMDDGDTEADTQSEPEAEPPVVPGELRSCLIGGNVMALYGSEDDWIHSGSLVVSDFVWSETIDGEPVDSFRLSLKDAPEGWSESWSVWLRSTRLRTPLAVGTYPNAMRAPFEDPGHPGLSVSGNGKGCNGVEGEFEIHDLAFDGETLVSLTATWLQLCDGGASRLRGCLHWER